MDVAALGLPAPVDGTAPALLAPVNKALALLAQVDVVVLSLLSSCEWGSSDPSGPSG